MHASQSSLLGAGNVDHKRLKTLSFMLNLGRVEDSVHARPDSGL